MIQLIFNLPRIFEFLQSKDEVLCPFLFSHFVDFSHMPFVMFLATVNNDTTSTYSIGRIISFRGELIVLKSRTWAIL
jgi:hypothetical protein